MEDGGWRMEEEGRRRSEARKVEPRLSTFAIGDQPGLLIHPERDPACGAAQAAARARGKGQDNASAERCPECISGDSVSIQPENRR